jgi:hypothetical protein
VINRNASLALWEEPRSLPRHKRSEEQEEAFASEIVFASKKIFNKHHISYPTAKPKLTYLSQIPS